MFTSPSFFRLPCCLFLLVISALSAPAQLIKVCGQGFEILAGDTTPSATNGTHFGNINVGPGGLADHVFTSPETATCIGRTDEFW